MAIVMLYLVFIFLCLNYPDSAAAADWNYAQSDSWQGLCRNGKEQSPIALSRKHADKKDFPPFVFDEYTKTQFADAKNNGHSVEIRLYSRLSIRGGGLPTTYFLDHLHFHWDAEHTVDGFRRPLELHLVHYSSKYQNLAQALNHQDGVAVLAVLFYLSPDNDVDFDPLVNLIEKIRGKNQVQKISFEIEDYLPRDKAGFFRYYGSLTTPPCTEGLIWTVFTNPIPISKNQARAFSLLQNEKNQSLKINYRPLQNLNGRKVFLRSSGPIVSNSNRIKLQIQTVLLVAIAFIGLI